MRRLVTPCILVSLGIPGALAAQGAPPGPRIRGYVQPRVTASGDSTTFLLRRARLGAQGVIAPWASYKVQIELRTGGTGASRATASATDLYVVLSKNHWRGVVGQLKVPFGREFITSSTVLELANRSIASDAIVPGRDVGAMVDWQPADGVHLIGGAFNGYGINRGLSSGHRLLYVGRASAQPIPQLDVGVDVASYADSTAWSMDAALRSGPWSARAEYLRRNRTGPNDHDAGWYAQAAYRAEQYHVQGVGRVEQYEPSALPGARGSAYTAGAQYFMRGDDLKLLGSYTLYTGAGLAARHDALTVQMQLRY